MLPAEECPEMNVYLSPTGFSGRGWEKKEGEEKGRGEERERRGPHFFFPI